MNYPPFRILPRQNVYEKPTDFAFRKGHKELKIMGIFLKSSWLIFSHKTVLTVQ